jgi:uncharacterized tellurite resistance protein B-like protein
MKNTFNSDEKAAIIKTLNLIIASDGNIHDAERQLMNNFGRKYNLSESDTENSWLLTHDDCCEIFRPMIKRKKEIVVLIFTKMAIADKYYTPEEAHIILKTVEKSNINLKF